MTERHRRRIGFMPDAVLGVVLAGGLSSRYGRDKALVEVGGVRIVDRVIAALRAVTPDSVLIANDVALAEQVNLPWRADVLRGSGALGGIHVALEWAVERQRPAVLAVACDMPFASIPLLRRLVERGASEDAPDVVIPESGGRRGVEPLCAFYSVRCIGPIERAIEAGDRRMIGFHDEVRVERVALDVVETFGDPRVLFLNVNTPEDREEAERIERDPGGQR